MEGVKSQPKSNILIHPVINDFIEDPNEIVELNDMEIAMARFDSMLKSLEKMRNEENGWNWALESAISDLIKSKHMYIVWLDETY